MVTIIDYNTGNLGSVFNMLKKIGVTADISSDADVIYKSSKLLLCGVGSFDDGMKNLEDLNLVECLNEKVKIQKVPILGICLGMQLFCKGSEEGVKNGLNFIDAETVKFKETTSLGTKIKIPHMGWNYTTCKKDSLLYKDMYDEARFYFVHSYYVRPKSEEIVLTETSYGDNFCSSYEDNNILGVQFHPEKSHKYGMKLLKNFVDFY